jgi:hypothetical protein
MFIEGGTATIGSGNTNSDGMFFGEYTTYVGSFTYNVGIIAKSGATATQYAMLGTLNAADTLAAIPGHYLCRNHLSTVGAVQVAKWNMSSHRANSGAITVGNQVGVVLPDAVSGKAYASRLRLTCVSPTALIGHLPGAWNPLGSLMGSPYDTINGSGTLAGSTFLIPSVWGSSMAGTTTNAVGRILLNLTNFD